MKNTRKIAREPGKLYPFSAPACVFWPRRGRVIVQGIVTEMGAHTLHFIPERFWFGMSGSYEVLVKWPVEREGQPLELVLCHPLRVMSAETGPGIVEIQFREKHFQPQSRQVAALPTE